MMVKQTRIIFDLSDIKAVRLQCGHCKAEVADEVLNYRLPKQCPLCGEDWDSQLANDPMGPNQLLIRAIKDVLQSDRLPMMVRFEIDGEDRPT